MTKRSTVIGGRKTYYWVTNPHKKTTVVMIHGYRGNHRGLSWMAQKMPEFRLIIPDLPGYGESEPMRVKHSLKNYSIWLGRFIAALNTKEYFLLGHSYGADVCINYASDPASKIKGLILISPVQDSNTLIADVGRAYYELALHLPAKLRHKLLADTAFDWLSSEVLLKSAKGKKKLELMEAGRKNLEQLRDKVVIESYLDVKKADLISIAESIPAPTLIIAGKKDAIAPTKIENRFSDVIKNSELVILPQAGHLSPLEIPQTVASKIKPFINGLK